jgi:hypothetical protein
MDYGFPENEKSKPDTLKMVVFANIFDNEKSADSLVQILKPKFKSAKTLKQELYLGCMH